MAMKLLPPGKRGPCWYIRGTFEGRMYEFSTGAADQTEAEDFLRRWLDHMAVVISEEKRRNTPAAAFMGAFEYWMIETLHLIGENVFDRRTGGQVRFYANGKGYRAAKVEYDRTVRSVLEHRVKFLLAHGWMPETIDHLDGRRDNNRLANLEASTPTRQAANRKSTPFWGKNAKDTLSH